MSNLRYILASLWHHARLHASVAAGVAIATAVVTGALIVGDSVRGSLRTLTLERLGNIETVLTAGQPFRTALGEELLDRAAKRSLDLEVAPLILSRGTLKSGGKQPRLAADVSVIGYDAAFGQVGGMLPELGRREVAITQRLQTELGIEVGDDLLLRLPASTSLPGDSTLAEKEDTLVSRRFRVTTILPNEGIARFSLQPNQRAPRNAFVALSELQNLYDWENKANALAVGQQADSSLDSQAFWLQLKEFPLHPELGDLGLSLTKIGAEDNEGATQITSHGMVLPDHVVHVIRNDFASTKPQEIVTYLANTIEVGQRKIPYSTITGVESAAAIGPLLDERGSPLEIADDEIVLNNWAASDLEAELGTEVVVTYYEPETTHGNLRVATPLKLKLKAIVPLADDGGNPTLAADPLLTPELPGVTDQRSISDWDLPFELVEEVRPQDEEYWDTHRTTPKAFVSLATAKRLWNTRWGTVSALRFPAVPNQDLAKSITEILDPAELGMGWLPVRLQGLAAAKGTTAFEGLFLGFSFFLMASALLLVNLLFKLGVETRASEVGTLAAVGYSPGRIRRLLVAETVLVAGVGALAGVAIGVGYAKLMIYGLSTWWVAATVEPFLSLHVTVNSLIGGFVVGIIVALLTTASSLRKLVRLPTRQLLAGDSSEPVEFNSRGSSRLSWGPIGFIAGAILLGILAKDLRGEAQAGAFFGSGALVLTALLWQLRRRLRALAPSGPKSLSLVTLAVRNARRNPSRTIMSISLAAVASFLIVALSAFRLAPSAEGTGGFDLLATSDQAILFDLNTSAGRSRLGFDPADEPRLANTEIVSLRVHAGEDASCLNLYQTSQPRVVGVPKDFGKQDRFRWGGLADESLSDDPWSALRTDCGTDADGKRILPIVLDKNTATYGLHLAGIGAQLSITDEMNNQVTLQVVGLLAGSILQGDVMMSESNFLTLYPNATGYRLFLIKSSDETSAETAQLLEQCLEDYGLRAVDTRRRLADLFAVQNTYLSTFQSLGALGLLLGTLGLAIAQLRSVVERRGELALMRAIGFRQSRLANMVLGENILLLLGGLGIGCSAALVAVLPHWWLGDADSPLATLAVLFSAILLAGIVAGALAVRAASRAPLVAALRGD